MLYWIIIGGLFFGGLLFVLKMGASIIKEDDVIQEQHVLSYPSDRQGDPT